MTSKTAEIAFPESLSTPAHAKLPALDASAWLTFRRFSLLMLLLIIASFPDVIFEAKTFLFRDYAFFGYPLAHYHREAFWQGQVPLWNPLNNCGIPYAAQWNTMVFYPFSLIYLLLPMPWSLGWFCLLHLLGGGLGMHCLAYRWTGNRLGASVAGIAYSFSGLTLGCLIWPNDIAALGLLPWVWLWVEKGYRQGGADLIIAVLVGATQMLSGAPEVILFPWMLVGTVWLCQFSAATAERWQIVRRTSVIVLLVASLCAVQLLPFLDLLRHSHCAGQVVADAGWSMPPWGWANFLVPLFRTAETSMGVFLQPGQGWLSSYYLGIAPFLLALVAVWKVRRPIVSSFGLVLGASLILALGEAGHLYEWIAKFVPLLALMRYPIKIVVLAGSIVPLLAAFAVAQLQSVSRIATAGEERDVAEGRELWTTIALVGAVFLLLVAAIVFFSVRWPGEDERSRTTLLSGLSRIPLVLAALGALFYIARLPEAKPRWRICVEAALLLLLWLDLISHAPSQNPTVEARAYQLALPPLSEMQPQPKPGESRAMLSLGTILKCHTTIVSNAMEAILRARLALYDNCNLNCF